MQGDSDDDSDDDEDETAELMKELERIKKEREEEAAKKVISVHVKRHTCTVCVYELHTGFLLRVNAWRKDF